MAENIATLEYKTLEEVLTVIRHLTSILSVSGMNLMEQICPTSEQLRDAGDTQMVESSDTEINNAVASEQDILTGRTCVAMGVILILKSYLKQLYNLSEEKCGKWVPGKKSALGDKPAIKRHIKPVSWDRMPFTHLPIVTVGDVTIRKKQFIHIWQEDGVSGEPISDTEII